MWLRKNYSLTVIVKWGRESVLFETRPVVKKNEIEKNQNYKFFLIKFRTGLFISQSYMQQIQQTSKI